MGDGDRYRVECSECGTIVADTDDGLFSLRTAERRAGWHEGTGARDEYADHYVDVIEATGASGP